MTKRLREQRREFLLELIAGAEKSREEVAALLWVGVHAVTAWLKPESSKSSNPVPMWAIELLALKTGQKVTAKRLQQLAGDSR